MKKSIYIIIGTLLIAATLLTLSASAMTEKWAEPTDAAASESIVDLTDSSSASAVKSVELSTVSSGGSSLIAAKMTAKDEHIFELSALPANSADYDYLQCWVDFSELTITSSSTEGKKVFIWLRLYDEVGACVDTYGMPSTGRFYTLQDGKWVEHKVDKWGRHLLPTSYVGYVRFDLKDLTEAVSGEVDNNGLYLDITKVSKIWFRHNFQNSTDKAANLNKSFYIGDFKLVRLEGGEDEPVETTTPAPDTTPSPETAETTAAPQAEPPKSDSGCGGSVSLLGAAALLLGAACLYQKKKK